MTYIFFATDCFSNCLLQHKLLFVLMFVLQNWLLPIEPSPKVIETKYSKH